MLFRRATLVGTDTILDFDGISILLIHPLHTSSFQMRALLVQCETLSCCSAFSLSVFCLDKTQLWDGAGGDWSSYTSAFKNKKEKRWKQENIPCKSARICLCFQTWVKFNFRSNMAFSVCLNNLLTAIWLWIQRTLPSRLENAVFSLVLFFMSYMIDSFLTLIIIFMCHFTYLVLKKGVLVNIIVCLYAVTNIRHS